MLIARLSMSPIEAIIGAVPHHLPWEKNRRPMDEIRQGDENITPLEDLKSQIQTQTITIRTLKVLLDQYKHEIVRIRTSKPSCTEYIPPQNDPLKLEPDCVEIKLALEVCITMIFETLAIG